MSDYYRVGKTQYRETQKMVQQLYHQSVTLAVLLKERLTPEEERMLANMFRLQIEVKQALNDIAVRAGTTPLPSTDEHQTGTIAHAQAMQYARDLVKALRQSKEQQRHLELTSQQLIRAEKLATVGQVAATMAHELGNIFAPLLMYTKLIYKETAGDKGSEVAEYASQITSIANRASEMLRQLVDAARSEPANMMSLNLIAVIQGTLALLSTQIKKQKVIIEHHYPDDLPPVLGRFDQLEQVFTNITLNALDAMPGGGKFTVTIDWEGQTNDVQAVTDFVTVHLSDNGEGIPPENIDKLFEPFFTTKERGAGSGLGLFVSYLIIDQQGGVIEVESEVGVGTTFAIKLPIVAKLEEGHKID